MSASQHMKIFRTSDTEFSVYNGQICEIIRPLNSDEADLDETGPMFKIAFGPQQTSKQIDAFADELFDE